MMLLYKAWRESRTRFLAGALLLAGYCMFYVFYGPEIQRSLHPGGSYHQYVDDEIFGGTGKLAFILPLMFLGIGGLLRERAHHTAVFSLTLPVSRAQLIGAQVVVGLSEVALLALLPAVLIQPLSALAHHSYPVADALRFSLLRFTTGSVIFSLTFLSSVLLRGEYTAPIACYVGLIVQGRVAQWLGPHGVSLVRAMDLRWYWRQDLPDLTGPLPWADLSIMMLIAILMFAAATRITQRQNL